MRNDPTFDEMRDRLARIDEAACNGGWQDSDCAWCRDILEAVRGSVYCPECAHINAIGHNCDDWDCEHGTLHEEREAKVPRQYCKFVGAAKDAGPNVPPVATSNPTRVWFTEVES